MHPSASAFPQLSGSFRQPVRRLLLWLAFALLSGLLAACGGDGPSQGLAAAPVIVGQPAGVTVAQGESASFSVTAEGSELSYQWLRDGAPILGATEASYVTPPVSAADSGARFAVMVGNAAGSVTSDPATLTVGDVAVAPVILAQPTAQTVTVGQSAAFRVTATGTEPLAYQWLRDGSPIAGADAASYTVGPVSAGDDGAVFAVTVVNAAGTATSEAALLTVTAADVPPAITRQPADLAVNEGQTASFSVAATGTAPLAYQWFRNGALIPGATSAGYTTPAVTAVDDGAVFSVIVSNAAGSVDSAGASLSVTLAPVMPALTSQPASVTVTAGQSANFSVTATGTAPLSYQWLRNGSPVAGANAASFTLANAAVADSGAVFSVVVSNTAGSVTSQPATLTVGAAVVAPAITTQPASIDVLIGQTASFSVVATGTAPLSYQWRKNGTNIPGATAAAYTTPVAAGGDDGAVFTVVVGNAAGSVVSASAVLGVAPVTPPAIVTHPASVSVPMGDTATFNVAANGTAPLSYQWRKNGVDIVGATSASYITPPVDFYGDQAAYTVVVSNALGTSVTSNPGVLTVTLPSTPVVQLAAGSAHSVVLRRSGAVYSWAYWNANGWIPPSVAGAGMTGLAAYPFSIVRAQHPDLVPLLNVAGVSAGTAHTVAVRSDGTVWSWGHANNLAVDGHCPHGDGACTKRFLPVQVKDTAGLPLTEVTQVGAGYYYSAALKTSGTVWAWGNNEYGQLGDGTAARLETKLNPVQVLDPSDGTGYLTGVARLSVGTNHVLALKHDGTVWAWGNNENGQLGDGAVSATVSMARQVQVAPGVPLTDVVAIAAGARHSLAVKSDGTVHAWGHNGTGALGDGTTTNRLYPTPMRDAAGGAVTGVSAVSAGTEYSLLLKGDGTLLATGKNDVGQLGDNTMAAYQVNPVTVKDAAGNVFGDVTMVSAAHAHTLVLRGNGTVWAWGLNNNYQLGDGTNVNRRNPVPVPAYAP